MAKRFDDARNLILLWERECRRRPSQLPAAGKPGMPLFGYRKPAQRRTNRTDRYNASIVLIVTAYNPGNDGGAAGALALR